MGRREEALKVISLQGKGLELGPLYNPVVRKDEASIFYIDHMSQAGLRKKYAKEPVPLDDIVPVDYVLKGTLKQTLGRKTFDYIIASHVVEHIPDTVRWLQEVAAVLTDDGILSLVIPDKRFTFDITRDVSRPSDVMGAYLDKCDHITSTSMYDFAMECRDKIDPTEVWTNPHENYRLRPLMWARKEAFQKCLNNLNGYVDAHCYVYTPSSFLTILRTIIEHGLLDFEVAYFQTTPVNNLEFYVSLRKSTASKNKKLASVPNLTEPKSYNELEATIEYLRQELVAITNSRSWRLTKPLRTILKKLGSTAS